MWKRTKASVDLSAVCWLIVRPTTKGKRFLSVYRKWITDPQDAALFSLDKAREHAAKYKLSRPTRYSLYKPAE